MARYFSGTTSQYLWNSSTAVVTDTPCTMSCWIKFESSTAFRTIMGVFDANGKQHLALGLSNAASPKLQAQTRVSSSVYGIAEGATSLTVGTWYNVVGRWGTGDSDRECYVNGVSDGTDTTSRTIFGIDITLLGLQGGGASLPYKGDLAYPCIWNVSLSDEEIAQLPHVAPWMVRPSAIAGAWDLGGTGNEPDLFGFADLTNVGSIANADNPGIILPSAQILQFPPAAAGGDVTLEAGAGSLTFAGTAATLEHNRALDAAAGSVSFTGVDATLVYTPVSSYELTADAGALSFTGTAAGLEYNRVIDSGAGTLSLTGTAATLTYTPAGSYELTADAGAFTFTGTAAALEYNQALDAGAGAISLSGTDAILTHNTAGAYTLAASAGVLSITGTAAALQYSRVLEAAAGSIAFTGTDATLAAGLSLTASPGSLTFTGSAVTIQYDRILAAEAGSLTFTGTAVGLTKSGIGTAESTTEHSITLLDASHPVTLLDVSHTGLI